MRDAHPAILTALTGPYTEPGYLVEMTLDAPMKLSTRDSVEHDGSVWVGGAAGVDLDRAQDWSTIDLTLRNDDGARTSFMLGGSWRESRVRVWQYRSRGSRAWPFLSTVEGWTASGATLAAVGGALRAAHTSGNIHIASPDSLGISGAAYRYVVARLRVSAGVVLSNVTVFYTTSGHSYDTGYRKIMNLSAVGTSDAVVAFDMHALSNGGTDWASNTINRFRFSIDTAGNTLPGGAQIFFGWVALSSSPDGGAGLEIATMPVFDGVLTACSRAYPEIRLAARRSVGRGAFLPHIRAAVPLCNHLPSAGSVVKHGSDVYELQPGS